MIEIRVPATSANLGPGFDCLGIALGLYNTFEIEESGTLLLENVDPRFASEDNLFVKAYRAAGGKNLRAVFHCDIPIARGLGSSAAMITAGICAAYLLQNKPVDAHAAFELASAMEGHPDNAAPCLFGGLTACMKNENGTYTGRKLPLHDGFLFTALIPDFEVSTEKAREILPECVQKEIVSYTIGHSILMADALCTGDMNLLQMASADRFHQPYRRQLIPGLDKAEEICVRDTGGSMVISGSGSTCLLISTRPLSEAARSALSGKWNVLQLPAAHNGAEVKKGELWQAII